LVKLKVIQKILIGPILYFRKKRLKFLPQIYFLTNSVGAKLDWVREELWRFLCKTQTSKFICCIFNLSSTIYVFSIKFQKKSSKSGEFMLNLRQLIRHLPNYKFPQKFSSLKVCMCGISRMMRGKGFLYKSLKSVYTYLHFLYFQVIMYYIVVLKIYIIVISRQIPCTRLRSPKI